MLQRRSPLAVKVIRMNDRNLKSNSANISNYDIVRHNQGKKRKWHEIEEGSKPKDDHPAVQKCCYNKCKLDGCVHLSLAHLKAIYIQFFHMTKDEKNLFQITNMHYIPENDKKGEWHYEFSYCGIVHPVCKKTFTSVLDVSERSVERLQARIRAGEIFPRNLQGIHNNHTKISEDAKAEAIYHMHFGYPLEEPHYCRERQAEGKKFLPAYLTKKQMYNDFCYNYGYDKMSKTMFFNLFNEQNLGIGRAAEDVCDECYRSHIALKFETDPEKIVALKAAHEAHLVLDEAATAEFKRDVDRAKLDTDFIVICVDVEQTFQLPRLPCSTSWYLRKFRIHNFCINNEGTENAHMYVWNEVDAKKGANEIGSCIYKFVREEFGPLANNASRHLTVWSDRARGQNNNFEMICLFKELVEKSFFSQITQKFFVSGHSYMSCDRNFGLIEKQVLKHPPRTQENLVKSIQAARSSNPFIVHELSFSDIVDIKPTKAYLRKPASLKVTNHLAFKVDRDIRDIVLTRSTHNPIDTWVPHKVVGKQYVPKPIILENAAYHEPQKLTRAKQKDLLKMIKFLDPADRNFFLKFITLDIPENSNSDNEGDDESDLE